MVIIQSREVVTRERIPCATVNGRAAPMPLFRQKIALARLANLVRIVAANLERIDRFFRLDRAGMIQRTSEGLSPRRLVRQQRKMIHRRLNRRRHPWRRHVPCLQGTSCPIYNIIFFRIPATTLYEHIQNRPRAYMRPSDLIGPDTCLVSMTTFT